MTEIIRVYVDETGDRGYLAKSSPFFTFAAVCVREQNDHMVRDFMDSFKVRISKPPAAKPKWTKLTHLERRVAAEGIRKLPIRIIYISVPKVNLTHGAHMANTTPAFYNYAARFVVERVSWLAKDNKAMASLTFERVKGFKPSLLTDYIKLLRQQQVGSVDWQHVSPTVKVDSPANIRSLLVADLVAGAFDSATRSDPATGLVEQSYLETIAPLVWHRRNASMIGTGFKVLGSMAPFEALPWWPSPAIS